MERLKAEGDGRQRRSHHHRLDARPRNRGSIQFVVRLVRLGRLSADGKMTEPWPGLLLLLNWRGNCKHTCGRCLEPGRRWRRGEGLMAKKRRIGSNAGRQATDPNPFTAFEYYAYADQFYDAFYKLGADHLHPSISWPRYFLLCHTIELALKAY